MFEFKPISHDSIAGALAKAERYRLLHEPGDAESICRDILAAEPDNHPARISLILALTDQIPQDPGAFALAVDAVKGLPTAYDRAYYEGIAWERRAKARHHKGGPGAPHYAYEWLMKAMHLFEEAERVRPPGNDEALLRWNACVRFLARHKELVERPEEVPEPIVSE